MATTRKLSEFQTRRLRQLAEADAVGMTAPHGETTLSSLVRRGYATVAQVNGERVYWITTDGLNALSPSYSCGFPDRHTNLPCNR